jgi:hypothetical protein
MEAAVGDVELKNGEFSVVGTDKKVAFAMLRSAAEARR